MNKFIISNHAKSQFKRRGLREELIEEITNNPDQIIEKESCMYIYQSLINDNGNNYLVRIFVNVCKDPKVIVTGYKTSKINKYYEG
ncbi:MAG: DUF4258 domain-containing protein [Bacteroidota bacterium]